MLLARRWILKIRHDSRYIIPWELWYYGILKSSRIFSINSIMAICLVYRDHVQTSSSAPLCATFYSRCYSVQSHGSPSDPFKKQPYAFLVMND